MKRSPLIFCLILLFVLVAAGIPAAASPSLYSATPSSGPNDSDVSVTITGSGFNSYTTVWLTPANVCDGENKIWGSIKSWSANTMTATFSLRGVTPAPYRLWVNSPYKDLNDNLHDDVASLSSTFLVYKGTGSTPTPTTTTTVTTTVTTETTQSSGENSVFFETNPSGAKVYVDGDEVGTSTFTFSTYKDGVHDVLIRKTGYEDYSDRVTIIDRQRVRFYAVLTPLSPGSTMVTTGTPAASGTPVKTVTTNKKSTLKIPTPLGTYAPPPEESPADPALALGAAGIAIGLVLFRRR
jgi:hypothetical protein